MPSSGKQAGPEQKQASSLDELANAIWDQAFASACQCSGPPPDNLDLTRQPRPQFCVSLLSLGLAQGLAKALAKYDQRIVAVYGYDLAGPLKDVRQPEAPEAIAIHLLIVVTTSSAALQALVASLSGALALSLRARPGFRSLRLQLLVDANIISLRELKLGTGLAGMVSTARLACFKFV